MQGYNVIVVFDTQMERMLMCRRIKEPYKNLSNFVGGKIEKNETGIAAAYRELLEETTISSADISLTHLVDFNYPLDNCYVEVYVGRLNKHIDPYGDENELYWSDFNHNFFDSKKYAGYGNIGHIMELIWLYKDKQLNI